ncbi:MAG: alpha/beta hydrolase [Marinifilaceae bacterium]
MKRNKILVAFLIIIGILVVIYILGPRVRVEAPTIDLPKIETPINELDSLVASFDANVSVKKDNNGVIHWANGQSETTDYVLLYLHGFSASRFEGYPLTDDFIKEFGVNAYLPRLAGHGLTDRDGMLAMTPKGLYESAKQSLVIASKLGNKVIIMGTSTGCTLALMLAADFPEMVDGLILYSPNIQIKQKAAKLLSGPWGLQIGRMVFGGEYRYTSDYGTESEKYWSCVYPVEAVVYLQQLLDERMTAEEFAKVKAPLFLGLYYKDEDNQDDTIEVQAAKKMFNEVSTPVDMKEEVLFPEAQTHVIACEMFSKAIPAVREATFEFAEKVLKLQPVKQD